MPNVEEEINVDVIEERYRELNAKMKEAKILLKEFVSFTPNWATRIDLLEAFGDFRDKLKMFARCQGIKFPLKKKEQP